MGKIDLSLALATLPKDLLLLPTAALRSISSVVLNLLVLLGVLGGRQAQATQASKKQSL